MIRYGFVGWSCPARRRGALRVPFRWQSHSSSIATPRGPRILFFGGDDVSCVALEALHDNMRHIAAAVPSCCQPLLHVVCPTVNIPHHQILAHKHQFPVPRLCLERGIPFTVVDNPRSISKSTFSLEAIEASVRSLPSFGTGKAPGTTTDGSCFDVAVVVSFRYFLPTALLLSLPPTINLHPSLLPKYRGASPIYSTLLSGDDIGGYSIIKILPGEFMDCGSILAQETLPIAKGDDIRSYFPAVTAAGASGLCRVLFDCDMRSAPCAVRSTWCHDDWKQRFLQKWHAATEQPNRRPLAGDPHRAPLLDKGAAELKFASQSNIACHNIWRAFAWGRHRLHPHTALNKRVTPIGEQQFERELRKEMRRVRNAENVDRHNAREREASCDSAAEPAFVAAMANLVVPFGVSEAVHPDFVGDSTRDELAALENEDTVLPPGTAFFPLTDTSVCAVKCRSGWFFWRTGVLRNSTPQAATQIRQGLALRAGTPYPHLFTAK